MNTPGPIIFLTSYGIYAPTTAVISLVIHMWMIGSKTIKAKPLERAQPQNCTDFAARLLFTIIWQELWMSHHVILFIVISVAKHITTIWIEISLECPII